MSMVQESQSKSVKATREKVPFRQIRANYDEDTITVYQAYNKEIASAAVEKQKLDASPLFRPNRMTWIKPSWCWMMYRAGYSYKDANQERILALKMKHEHFLEVLKRGVLTHEHRKNNHVTPESVGQEKRPTEESKTRSMDVKIQWDPERSPRLEKLEYRSIQIGIPVALQEKWINDWIFAIEDVTETARELKRVLDETAGISREELAHAGLLPNEKEFDISQDLNDALEMG